MWQIRNGRGPSFIWRTMFLIGRRYGFSGIRGRVRGAAQCEQFVSTPPSWARASIGRPAAVDAFKTNCILGKRAPDRIKTRTLLFLPGEAVGWLMHRASCESV